MGSQKTANGPDEGIALGEIREEVMVRAASPEGHLENGVNGDIDRDEEKDGMTKAIAVREANLEVLNREQNIFYQVLPDVVWRKVMENVVMPNQIQLAASNSPYFNYILKEKLQIIRVPHVFKVLTEQGYLKKPESKVSPSLCKLRLLSKTWRHTVDLYLQKLADKSKLPAEWKRKLEIDTSSPQPTWVPDFLDHFREFHQLTKANPFIIPNVELRNDPLWPWTPYLIDLLSFYGSHLKVLKIFCELVLDPLTRPLYDRLLQVIILTPNITTLQLTLDHQQVHFEPIEFPYLPKLRSFFAVCLPLPIFNAVLNANPEITELVIEGRHEEIRQMDHPVLRKTLHLKKLIVCIGPILEPDVLLLLLNVPDVRKRGPFLEDIVLCFPKVSEPGTTQLFEMLNLNWANTLKRLALDFVDDKEHPNGPDIPPLPLPSLEEFRLDSLRCFNMDFLLPCKDSLKKLHIKIRVNGGAEELQRAVDAEKTLRFYSYLDNPLESNVWTEFSKLEKLTCRVTGPTMEEKRWKHTRVIRTTRWRRNDEGGIEEVNVE